jgi:hypothetical protein
MGERMPLGEGSLGEKQWRRGGSYNCPSNLYSGICIVKSLGLTELLDTMRAGPSAGEVLSKKGFNNNIVVSLFFKYFLAIISLLFLKFNSALCLVKG